MKHVNRACFILCTGFPVLVVITSDRDRHFHPFGIAVCSSDSEKDCWFHVAKKLKEKLDVTLDVKSKADGRGL